MTPFIGIKIEHFVTRSVFAKALADHHWRKSEDFPSSMTKKEAMRILKSQLFHLGGEGEYQGHWDGASEEFVRPFTEAYDAALEWINKNYPYLAGQPG